MRLTIEVVKEGDARWSARISGMPETESHGSTAEEVIATSKAKGLEALARRLLRGAIESNDLNDITFVSKDNAPATFSAYIDAALEDALIEPLDDGSFAGRVSPCAGVVAFGRDQAECLRELRSALEDWVVAGLKLRHPLPVIRGICLHDPAKANEPVGAL